MYYVYLLASKRNGTLYCGVTGKLATRVGQHKDGKGSIFASRYGVQTLVWYEPFERIDEAIAREKQIKGWNRAWKLKLIEASNPAWQDISTSIPYE